MTVVFTRETLSVYSCDILFSLEINVRVFMSVSTDRTQHQQKQDKDYERQYEEQQPGHSRRGTTGRNDSFAYMGSKISKIGGAEKWVKAMIQKASVAFFT